MNKILLIIVLLTLNLLAQDDSVYYFKHYNIGLPIDNKGVLADVEVENNLSQMRFVEKNVLYSSGFLISGFANDTLWANGSFSVSSYRDYLAGSYKFSEFDSLAQIYAIKKSDEHFGERWQKWKNAVKLGADFYDGDNDKIYNPIDKNSNGKWDSDEDRPDLLGDQTAWCVYKDAVPSEFRYFRNVKPVGIEIQQTVFASSINESFENTIFVRYRIENAGLVAEVLDSVYFSIYADPDLGDHRDDLVGCDTLIDAGYVYQTEPDDKFEVNTPSLIMHYVQGPISYIPNKTYVDNNNNGSFDSQDTPLENAYSIKSNILGADEIVGAENLKISSFSNYMHTIHEPEIINENDLRIKMIGYASYIYFDPCDFSDLSVVLNEDCSNISPYYWYSGDPIYLKGWINTRKCDQRVFINTGPFQLQKNKPVDIVAAYTIGEGNHPLLSLKLAKINARKVQFYFRNNAFEDENNVTSISSEPIFDFRLYQNYPNPFNPSTTIEYRIPNIEQRITNVELKVYDVLGREVATLVNKVQRAGKYEVKFNASNLGSGVYFYQLRSGGFVESRKMVLLK